MPSADPRPNGPQPKVNGGTAGPGSEDASSNPALADATSDLTNAVDEMLKQLQDKFGRVSEEMVTRSGCSLSTIPFAFALVFRYADIMNERDAGLR